MPEVTGSIPVLPTIFLLHDMCVQLTVRSRCSFDGMLNRKARLKKLAAFLIGGAFAVALVGFGLFQLSRSRTFQACGEIIARVDTPEKVVALTFDDGPARGFTDEILKILETEETSATFFLTGREINANLDETRRIVEAGHEIGNHSWSHARMVLKSPEFVRQEIQQTDEAITAAGYTSQTLFRPPYGKKLFVLPWYLARTGRTTITWDVEPESFPDIAADPEKITAHVLENAQPGSIILLHVMYDEDRKSLRAVRPIIKGRKQKGYGFVTVSDLVTLGSQR